MLRVNQVLAFLLLLCAPLAWGQVFQAVPQRAMQATDEDGLEWLEHCNVQSDQIAGVGIKGGGVQVSAATFFSSSVLSSYAGKSISVAAVYAANAMSDASVFVLKGDDINTTETVCEAKVSNLNPGWNFIKFDSPVAIDGKVGLAVGYSILDMGNYPIAFDGYRAKKNTSFLSVSGQEYAAQSDWGNLMVRALIGGDASQLGYSVVPEFAGLAKYMPKGEIKITLNLVNNSFMPVTDITLNYSVNGSVKEIPVSFDEPFNNNSSATCVLDGGTLEADATLEVSVVKVNGKDNMAVNKLTKDVVVYDPEGTVERTILIEKFTGQHCPKCPAGEENILLSIKGMESRVARIDHHYGYVPDIFTIAESTKIGKFYGVNGAPNCMMNRSVQTYIDEYGTPRNELVWWPFYMTNTMVADEISRPAYVSINIDRKYDEVTRELIVTVSGKATKDMAGERLTVALTQSGYIEKQAGVGEKYEHNDFPLSFLSAYNGDELQIKEDNTYEHTYTYTIAKKYSSVKPDVDEMDLVAFISGWSNTGNEGGLQNAAMKKVTDNVPAAIVYPEIEADNVQISVSGGKFVVAGSVESVAVFTANGMQVENSALPAGLYIVRVVADGKVYVRKMMLAD